MLPKRKQMLALSATYTPALLSQLEELMHCPRKVLLCPESSSLLGVRQFFCRAPGEPLLQALLRRNYVSRSPWVRPEIILAFVPSYSAT